MNQASGSSSWTPDHRKKFIITNGTPTGMAVAIEDVHWPAPEEMVSAVEEEWNEGVAVLKQCESHSEGE